MFYSAAEDSEDIPQVLLYRLLWEIRAISLQFVLINLTMSNLGWAILCVFRHHRESSGLGIYVDRICVNRCALGGVSSQLRAWVPSSLPHCPLVLRKLRGLSVPQFCHLSLGHGCPSAFSYGVKILVSGLFKTLGTMSGTLFWHIGKHEVLFYFTFLSLEPCQVRFGLVAGKFRTEYSWMYSWG